MLLPGCNDSAGSGPGQNADETDGVAGRDVVLTIDEGQDVDPARIEDTVSVLEQRLIALGLDDAAVQGDTHQVVLTLPSRHGIDQELVVAVLVRRAALEFRRVLEIIDPSSPQFQRRASSCKDPGIASAGQLDQEVFRCNPALMASSEGDGSAPAMVYRLGSAFITNDGVESARASSDPSGTSVVELDFNADGAETFERMTGEVACEDVASPTRQFAIVVDGVVESAPTIAEDVPCGNGIAGGKVVITAGDAHEAETLAVAIGSGALPLALSAGRIPASED